MGGSPRVAGDCSYLMITGWRVAFEMSKACNLDFTFHFRFVLKQLMRRRRRTRTTKKSDDGEREKERERSFGVLRRGFARSHTKTTLRKLLCSVFLCISAVRHECKENMENGNERKIVHSAS